MMALRQSEQKYHNATMSRSRSEYNTKFSIWDQKETRCYQEKDTKIRVWLGPGLRTVGAATVVLLGTQVLGSKITNLSHPAFPNSGARVYNPRGKHTGYPQSLVLTRGANVGRHSSDVKDIIAY